MAKLVDVLRELLGDVLDADVEGGIEKLLGDNKDKDNDKGGDDYKEDVDNKDNKDSSKDDSDRTKDSKDDTTDNSSETEDIKDDDSDETETVVEGVESRVEIFAEGWFNEETCEIDLTKINDETVVKAFERVMTSFTTREEMRKIKDAIMEAISKESINVKPETIYNLLDKEDIKLVDGKVHGVGDALKKLKDDEPGLFKEKGKESNPINEGFDPVNKKSSTNSRPTSFVDAFNMQV